MVGLVCCGIGVILAWLLQSSYLKDFEDAPALLGGAGRCIACSDTYMRVCVCERLSFSFIRRGVNPRLDL